MSLAASSSSTPMDLTSPTGTPLKSSGAPTDNPRSDPVKFAVKGTTSVSGRFMAWARSGYRVKIVSSSACRATGEFAGVSNAMPPSMMDTSGPSPVTWTPATRARTTQNRVSSTRWGAAPLTTSTVTTTRERSLVKWISFTSPTSTFLYLIFVLPASSPSAVLKVIVIVGPLSRTAFTASQPPTSAATIGISHTRDSDPRRFGTTSAGGMSSMLKSSGVLAIVSPHWIPHEPRIKRLRREHRHHHHRTERDRRRPRLDRRQGLELDQRGEHRRHLDVHHGPAPDDLPDPGQLGP